MPWKQRSYAKVSMVKIMQRGQNASFVSLILEIVRKVGWNPMGLEKNLQ